MDSIDVEKLLAEAESKLLEKKEIYQLYGLTESDMDNSRFSESEREFLKKDAELTKQKIEEAKQRARARAAHLPQARSHRVSKKRRNLV